MPAGACDIASAEFVTGDDGGGGGVTCKAASDLIMKTIVMTNI
jgi:hypothetical protein